MPPLAEKLRHACLPSCISVACTADGRIIYAPYDGSMTFLMKLRAQPWRLHFSQSGSPTASFYKAQARRMKCNATRISPVDKNKAKVTGPGVYKLEAGRLCYLMGASWKVHFLAKLKYLPPRSLRSIRLRKNATACSEPRLLRYRCSPPCIWISSPRSQTEACPPRPSRTGMFAIRRINIYF